MESLAEVARIIASAASSPSADQLSQAGMELVKARNKIREELQNLTIGAMKPIISKLKKNEPLSPEEKDLVEMWIVGDAEGYTQTENDYRAWLEEFQRLGRVLGDQATVPSALPEMLKLYGSLEDAVRLAADLQFFLEEKERVGRFQQAIQNLSASEAEMLANILQEKLTSPEM
jgi:ribosome biogenesis SPOUT family RNA methylase Rps3